MKTTIFYTNAKKFYSVIIFSFTLIFFLTQSSAIAQSFCSTPLPHSNSGYTTSIVSVTDNGGSFTIKLRGEHNGCNDQACKALNHYSIEAAEGTYSNIEHETIYGSMSYNGINMGPNLGGTPFDGFRIASISGIGNGQAGIFHITYTLTYLQDQQVQVKSGGLNSIVDFYIQDFLDVMTCNVGGTYAMPEGGKIDDPLNKIGPELTALSNYIGVPQTDEVYKIVPDEDQTPTVFYVVAEFVSVTGQYGTLLSTLQNSHGLRMEVGDDVSIITGQIPVGELSFLNDVGSLASASPVYPVTTNVGLATSQGDTSMVSNIARNIYSVHDNGTRRFINGEDIKIGVLSNSFDTKTDPPNQANDDVLKWDLPGIGVKSNGTTAENPYNNTDVITIKEYPYGEASDEGRAMMQIIHDVAPGADLYFRTGVLGAVDMAVGIDELAAANCDIIVDDITYITQPFFEDGTLAQKVDEVTASGISYFTSAGNFGGNSCSGTFLAGSNSITDVTGTPHKFGLNADGDEDYFQSITADLTDYPNPPAHYTIVLQWEDDDPTSTFDNTKTDLDIYIANEYESILLGYNKVNVGGKAIEVLPFVITETTDANIVIVKASNNTANINFKYVIFRGQLDINEYNGGNATIVGHANSAGAMTVGAIRYDKTPAYGGTLDIMSFSSLGGLLVDGTDRSKPNFTAPNVVNTTVNLGNGDWDHNEDPEADTDTHPNFIGTSAAAPHAAAVAALLLDAKSSYLGESMLPNDVRNTLILSAIGSGSYDNAYGNGFIQADMALWELGNPAPIISELTWGPIDSVPGANQVNISVSVSYWTDDTKLYFDGTELATTFNPADTTLTATVPQFDDLYPPVTAYNPPKEVGGKDGGHSIALYFTEMPTIVVTVADTNKTYGENMPVNDINYEVVFVNGDTLSLENSGLTSAQITRINDIQIDINASALANAGIWSYYVNLDDCLGPLYGGAYPPIPSTEDSLLSAYNFDFNLGVLEITKLNLNIKPEDINAIYGEPIPPLSYIYDYDSSDISQGPNGNNIIIQNEIEAAHVGDVLDSIIAVLDSAQFMSDGSGGLVPNSYYMSVNAKMALAMVNKQALAMVNGKALAMVNGQALAMVNGQALAMVNGQALAMVNRQALAMVNVGTLLNAQALAMVNVDPDGQTNKLALAMVNGQALAMVNNPDPEWLDPSYVNGQALAMVNQDQLVNGLALAMVNQSPPQTGLVNGQALAMVNTISFNDINNEDAILILTVADVMILTGDTIPAPIEMISLNTLSGNNATNIVPPLDPHKVAPGSFIASNFNMEYALGEMTVDQSPLMVNFNANSMTQTYNGNQLGVTIESLSYFSENTPRLNATDYEIQYSYNGVWSNVQPTDAGQYPVQVALFGICDTNYSVSYSIDPPVFTIDQAPVLFTFSEYNLVYSGLAQEITVLADVTLGTAPDPVITDDFLIEYVGNHTDAGNYPVSINIIDGNYKLDSYDPTLPSLTIEKAPVLFTFSEYSLPYNGLAQEITVLADVTLGTAPEPVITDDFLIEYVGNHTDAGNYPVSINIIDGNYKLDSYYPDPPSLTINAVTVTFSYINNSVSYNGYPQGLGVNDVTSDPPVSFVVKYFYDGLYNDNLPTNVFDYPVQAFIGDNNYIVDPITSADLFKITKADLLITTLDTLIINEGESEPSFSFDYDEFLGLNDNAVSVFGTPLYTTAYNSTSSGPGPYHVIFADVTNYRVVFPTPINLYVNPDGPGTKAVVPKLDCVEIDEYGNHIAYYEYDNKNNDTVWVMIGDDNLVTGGGPDRDISQQPIKFVPGGGTWIATFDGSPMSWEVSSQHHGHKASHAQNASSNSKNCSHGKSAEIEPSNDDEFARVYPNPVSGKLTVSLGDDKEIRDVAIFNLVGKKTNVSEHRVSDQILELDMASLKPGVYLVKVQLETTTKIFRVIKQ